MEKVYISSLDDTKAVRELAKESCARYGFDPVGWEFPSDPTTLEYQRAKISESCLFVGIYKAEYGTHTIPLPESERSISQIEFELNEATRILGNTNILLFAQEAAWREPNLERLIGKRHLATFNDQTDFNQNFDEALKKWKSLRKLESETRVREETLSGIVISCSDRSGILSEVTRTLFRLGGNIERSNQRSYFNKTTMMIVVDWQHRVEPFDDEYLTQHLTAVVPTQPFAPEIVVFGLNKDQGAVNAKAFFEIEFFDQPGAAQRIFSAFAAMQLSVIESELETISSSPAIKKYSIVANATHIKHNQVMDLAKKLEVMMGVFRVDKFVRYGDWWY